VNIAVLDDDIANISADAEAMHLSSGMGVFRVTIPRRIATAQATASTTLAKLDENAIPGGLHNTTVMSGDSRISEFAADRCQGAQSADLVDAHETAITNDVSCEDRGQPSLYSCFVWHVARASPIPSQAYTPHPGRQRTDIR
jgi:hypothetical protein